MTAAQARRKIAAARRKVERGRAIEAEGLIELGRALDAAPKPPKGGTIPPDAITFGELAELAGLPTRQAVYDLIRRARGEGSK